MSRGVLGRLLALTVLLSLGTATASPEAIRVCRFSGRVMRTPCCKPAKHTAPQLSKDTCCEVHRSEPNTAPALVPHGVELTVLALAVPLPGTPLLCAPAARLAERPRGPAPPPSRRYLRLEQLLL